MSELSENPKIPVLKNATNTLAQDTVLTGPPMTNRIPYVPRTYKFTLKVATKFPSSSIIDPQIVSFL